MFSRLTDEELLRRSDLVALGVWVGQSPAGAGTDLGRIDIDEVLKGPPGLKQALVAVPAASAPRSGSDLPRQPGERGLWLLRLKAGAASGGPAVYLADHPQRFETDATRIATLRRLLLAR